MSSPGRIPIDEVVTFDQVTVSPYTSAPADADSTPTFAVYEDTTDTDIGIGGNMTKRTSLTGNYRASMTLSGANGFEAGKWYNVICSATVGGVSGKSVAMTFMCVPAESSAGVPAVDTTRWDGTAVSTPATAGIPDINVKNIDNDAASASGTVTFPGTIASTTNITAGTITTVSGNVTGSVGSVTGLTASNLDTTVSSRMATFVYTAPPSAATIAAAVWAYVCEGAYTALNLIRVIAAACGGKASGLATTTAVYRAADDSKDRITATVDANGNRSAVTLDGS